MLDYYTNRNRFSSKIFDNHGSTLRGWSGLGSSFFATQKHLRVFAGAPNGVSYATLRNVVDATEGRNAECFSRPSVPDRIPFDLLIIHKLLQINAHWGSRTSNSAFKPYLLGFRNGIAIINLEQTVMCLQRALKFLKYVIRKKGHLLFVNHDPECARIIQKTAEKTGQSCLINKWIGGFFTNRRQMNNSVSLTDFTGSFAAPKIDTSRAHFTKASFHFKTMQKRENGEANEVSFPLSTSHRFARPKGSPWSGETVGKKFDCLIIFNPNYNAAAILEAHRAQIAIVSIVDSDTSNYLISKITYPIPINSRSFQCVYYICHLMIQTILQIKTK
nr:ribosomal protein S2 [Coleochaete scutata]